MQARRASRELALILFSQFDKKIVEYSEKDFEANLSDPEELRRASNSSKRKPPQV